MLHIWERGEFHLAMATKDEFNLPDELFQEESFQPAAKKGCIHELQDYGTETAFEIKNLFHLSDEFFQEEVKKVYIRKLEQGDINFVNYIKREKDKFNLPDEVFQGVEAQVGPQEGFIRQLSYNNGIDAALEIKNSFNLSDEFIQAQALKAFIRNLEETYHEEMGDEEYSDEDSSMEYAILIKDKFNLQNKLIREAVKEVFISKLKEVDVGRAIQISDTFHVKIDFDELCSCLPETARIIERLETEYAELNINFRSIDIFMQLASFNYNPESLFDILEENHFLLGALVENKRHGMKLLFKFQEFDNISQKNIKTLYDFKAEIKNKYPNIDCNSFEFRMLMQKRLIEFGNNKNILVKIGKEGVDIRQWLAYSTEKHFDLGKEDDTLFSEQIQSPIKRIDESIGNYLSKANSVLAFYRKDLAGVETPSEKKAELFEKLEKMRVQMVEAQQNSDTRKIEGIQKGVANLEKQLEQLKPMTVWNKLVGEMNNVKIISKDLSGLYDELCSLEEEQKNTGADRKKQIDLKEKIKQQEFKIKNKIVDLDELLSGFRVISTDLLGKTFGKDQSDSIMQEINMSVGMDLDHYHADLSTIQSLFKNDASSLEKTPMRIAIAPRNPDTDLYLGNDCPCCIKIDNDTHGAESPIADYVTDLGMHNIVVYDEKRKKPVAVAWCFVGKNENSEGPILVVDNIEADTGYSIPFKSQLKKELGSFIAEFAKTIKIERIIQGPNYNKLEVLEILSEIDRKLGGTNRATGYYFDAMRDNENDDWQDPDEIRPRY